MTERNLVLISHKLCPYVQRARIVLDEKGIHHQIRFIDLSDKPEWFLRISPLGKVPVLIVDGRPLFESAPIAEYLDETTPGTLHPVDAFDRARHRAWVEFASDTLASIATFYSALDDDALERAGSVLRHKLQRVNDEKAPGPYFSGSRFSLVDAAFAPVFRYFDVIDDYVDIGIGSMEGIRDWRISLACRRSVQRAVVSDYHERLRRFFLQRGSALARVVRAMDAA